MNSFAAKAPVLIVVITERSRYSSALGGLFRGVQFSLMDIAIACEHFCLQATDLGLGTCMLGWINERGIKKELGLPESVKIDIMISMGYPKDIRFLPPKTRKSIDDIRRFL
jgi:nitroreductase